MWTKIRVGIIKTVSAGLNVKLCDQITTQISTPHPQAGPICTPSMDAPKLWCYKETGNSIGYLTVNPKGTQAQYPTNSGHFPIL